MLELDLDAIASTLPEEDVPRWFVVPTLDEAEGRAWAEAMTDILAPDFAAEGDPTSREHLLAVMIAAVEQPRTEPFDQRLLYLPYGASSGLVVEVLIIPVASDDSDQFATHARLLGSLAQTSEQVLDAQDRQIGLRHFHLVQGEPTAPGNGVAASAPDIAVLWSVHRRLVGGIPADVIATASSPDAELTVLGLYAYCELVLGDELFV